MPRVPVADPDAPLRVGPHAARTLPARRRLDDGRLAGLDVDARDVAARERRIVDVPAGRRGDAVGSAPPRRLPHPDVVRRGIDAAVDARLAREPDPALPIEGRRVEVRVSGCRRQRPALHGASVRIDAHDRVLAAVGDPRRAVGTDDHAVRRRARPQRRFPRPCPTSDRGCRACRSAAPCSRRARRVPARRRRRADARRGPRRSRRAPHMQVLRRSRCRRRPRPVPPTRLQACPCPPPLAHATAAPQRDSLIPAHGRASPRMRSAPSNPHGWPSRPCHGHNR